MLGDTGSSHWRPKFPKQLKKKFCPKCDWWELSTGVKDMCDRWWNIAYISLPLSYFKIKCNTISFRGALYSQETVQSTFHVLKRVRLFFMLFQHWVYEVRAIGLPFAKVGTSLPVRSKLPTKQRFPTLFSFEAHSFWKRILGPPRL